jgi:hypothetical protein
MAKQRDPVFTGEENRIFKYNNYHLAINGIFWVVTFPQSKAQLIFIKFFKKFQLSPAQ